MQFQEAEQFFIPQRFPDLVLDEIRFLVNLLQIIQERRRRRRKNLKEETRFLVRMETGGAVEKFLNHKRRLDAHRDDEAARDENADRERVIRILLQHDRRIDDDENVIVLRLHVRAFLAVERRLEDVRGNIGNLRKAVQFLMRRRLAVDPRAFLRRFRRDGAKFSVFIVFVSREHERPSFRPFSGSL